MNSRRPASWTWPTRKLLSAERARRLLAGPQPSADVDRGPGGDPPDSWWDSVLADPRARGPRVPDEDRPLNQVRAGVLRVECLKCFRIIECQKADAIKLAGPTATWRAVSEVLL